MVVVFQLIAKRSKIVRRKKHKIEIIQKTKPGKDVPPFAVLIKSPKKIYKPTGPSGCDFQGGFESKKVQSEQSGKLQKQFLLAKCPS